MNTPLFSTLSTVQATAICCLVLVLNACSKKDEESDNRAPEFISEDRVDVHEGNRKTNYSVEAKDADGDRIVYSVTGGQDRAFFSVDASSGVLKFIEVPIHRDPKDGNRDNEYLVDITAADGRGGNAVSKIKVTIIPSVTSPLASVREPEMPFGSDTQVPIETRSPHSLAKDKQPRSDNGSMMVSVALDERNNRALVVDWNYLALMSVDLTSGRRDVISSRDRGKGEPFISPKVVDLDHRQARALVVDVGRGALMSVSLINGDRTIISDDEIGSGTPFVLPGSVSTDPVDSRVLVVDWSLQALFEVDLVSGDRTLISGGGVGEGVAFKGAYAAVMDAENNRAFVVDKGLAALVVVDLVSGDRTILSGAGKGYGEDFVQPYALAYQPQLDRVLVVDGARDVVIAVEADTGNRSVVVGGDIGSGPAFDDPRAIALRRNSNRALIVDWGARALYEADAATGNRILLSGKFALIDNLPADGTREALVKSLPEPAESHGVENINQNSIAVASEPAGGSVRINAPTEMVLNDDGRVAYVFDAAERALYAVSLTSGEKKMVSGKQRGQGSGLGAFVKLAYLSGSQSLLVLDVEHRSLLQVDLVSGDRILVSSQQRGGGAVFKAPMDLKYDAKTARAFIVDPEQKAIISVSIVSGDRMLLPLN